jgi:hypothetical protein
VMEFRFRPTPDFRSYARDPDFSVLPAAALLSRLSGFDAGQTSCAYHCIRSCCFHLSIVLFK